MKKSIILLSLVLSFGAVNSQILYIDDTVNAFDDIYLPHTTSSNCLHIISCAGWGIGAFNVSAFPCNDHSDIYGIALSTNGDTSTTRPPLMLCRRDGNHFEVIDSIAPISRIKKVGYELYNGEVAVRYFLECYFDSPKSLKRDKTIIDSVFLSLPLNNLYFFEKAYEASPTLKIFCLDSNYNILNRPVSLVHAYGGFFPIMELRCDVPKRWGMTDCDNTSATIKWQRVGDEEVYQLAIGTYGNDSIIDIYDTSISSYTHIGASGINYSFKLRKACRYTTSEYDTLVWSDWTPPVGYTPVAIDNAGDLGPNFSVSPNPATDMVTVSIDADAIADGGTLQVLDLAGRLLTSHELSTATCQLPTADYPSGTYLLRLVTPKGTGFRRIVVAR